MKGKRLLYSIPLFLINSATKRAEYFRKHHIFYSMGENCSLMRRNVPLNPQLIKIGNNVHMASNVGLITHDITHIMLNHCDDINKDNPIRENKGCIEIGDNVFVGAGTRILPNVKVGSNVVIGAGSIVNKDVPDNSVVAGVPARIIGTFDAFVAKRLQSSRKWDSLGVVGGVKTEQYWQEFENERK